MKVKIKCSGLIVELPDNSVIDLSYYEVVEDVFHVEQPTTKSFIDFFISTFEKKIKKKNKNDND